MIYFDIFEKDRRIFLRLDVTDIFSKKNKAKYKLEVKYKDKTMQRINNYSLFEFDENDEYLFFAVFDITDINFELLEKVLLIQYKKHTLCKNETVYHTFSI